MSKTKPIILQEETLEGKIKEITKRLEQGITELFNSDRYKEYLKVMSKFHNYSLNNTVLIAMQKPDATFVAGYNAWKNEYGRHVKQHEKGIRILAPAPYKILRDVEKKDPETEVVLGKDGESITEKREITIPAFKVVSVFDVSQTEGREFPAIAVDMLTGNVDNYEDFFTALEKSSPVPVTFENIEGGTHGYYHLVDKRIAIQKNMSELQTLKTAIHEITHAKLHDIDLKSPKDKQKQLDSHTREVEAESVAYTVCQHYGLDTSDFSFGYVAGWSSGRELVELKSSLETIRVTAAEIINSIDEHLAEIQKARETDKAPQVDTSGVEKEMKDFLENLSSLYNAQFDIKPANFTINGNAVKSQEALLENGETRISARFYNWWEPMQIVEPSKAIRQKIEVVAYKNGNPIGMHVLAEKKSMSLKNAEKNYYEMLKQWKSLTKQREITFGPIDRQSSNRSILDKLHENQKKTTSDQADKYERKQHMEEVTR